MSKAALLYPIGMVLGFPLGMLNRPGHPLDGQKLTAFKQWSDGRIQCVLVLDKPQYRGWERGQYFAVMPGEFVPCSEPSAASPPPAAPSTGSKRK